MSSSAAPPEAEPEAAPPAAPEGGDIQITGLVDIDPETGAELAAEGPEGAGAPPEIALAPAPEGEGAPEIAVHAPAATPAEPASDWQPSMLFLSVLTFVVAAADIASKEWVKRALAGENLRRTGRHIEVIRDHFDFIFAQNPGGAWSFLRGVPDGLRRPFFLFVSAAAIVFIVMVYQRLDRRQWAMRWGLPLALGGAIGNLQDRIRYGWVVDFIDVYWKGKANEVHWPTFNVADIAIVVGVGLMALDLLSLRKSNEPAPPEPAPEAAGGAA